MGTSDKMMSAVLGRMSIKKKQEMMLKMMPMMMQDVDMAETMVKMIPMMLDQISLLDLFNALKKLFPHILKGVNSLAEFMTKWDELVPQIVAKLPALMLKMMPIMEVVMPMMMAQILPVIMTEENMRHMETIPKRMAPKMMANEKLHKLVPEMMARIMPLCLNEMLPYMDESRKEIFISSINEILNKEQTSQE
jgi:hypothetical protein